MEKCEREREMNKRKYEINKNKNKSQNVEVLIAPVRLHRFEHTLLLFSIAAVSARVPNARILH